MIFSFSPNFRVATYAELLRVLVAEIDLYRQLCGITLRDLSFIFVCAINKKNSVFA